MSATEHLRGYLGRLLGWTKTSAIEDALRSIELATEHRAHLVLCGRGDLVPLAHGLHRRAFCAGTPFSVCDPRRSNTGVTVRLPVTHLDIAAAFDAAVAGALCTRRRRPPHEFSSLVGRPRDGNVQYICLAEDSLQWLVRPGPIEVPALAQRAGELPRVVDEYVFDAVVELAPTSRTLAVTDRDRQWLIEHAARMSLAEIEKATLRLVALRSSPNLSQAAARLGMAAVSLHRWMGRRRLPVPPGAAHAA
jgi:hypothetical protein